MSLPEIVTRDRWIHARVTLLEREKALTKARDKLAAEHRRLPMVEVAEDYRFSAADGSSRTLLDLFEGRHQLIVDHYMFDPDWEDGCMSCAGRVDQYGNTAHLHERDTNGSTTACRSTTPSTIPITTIVPSPRSPRRTIWPRSRQSWHGTSVFLRVGDRVFHTYSTYGRGTEQVGGTH